MDPFPSTGASAFCSRLWYWSLNLSGTTSGENTDGIERYTPVNGGENFSSRYICDMTAQMFAPAEIPPMMNAFAGSPPRDDKFEATCTKVNRKCYASGGDITHFRASKES